MAVAPLNKFVTKALPVGFHTETVYETPTGVSSIILYAQVANVGINTYPRVTLSHKRVSTRTKTLNNTNVTRIVKDIEVPPNDAVVIIDGRLVLERNARIKDSLIIEGTQDSSQVFTISNAEYQESTGLTTITTSGNHGFAVGDEIVMSRLHFQSCDGHVGTTTYFFPDTQRTFVVDAINIGGNVNKFETNVGIVEGIRHYNYLANSGKVGPVQMEVILSILESSLT